MKPILGDAGLPVLARFARRGTLLALDYDGTLAPIVPDPRHAPMRERTRQLLAEATRRYPTVILTGRARHDLMRQLDGLPSLQVIGNHGLETDAASGARYARRVKAWHASLAATLEGIPGLLIEDKRYSLSVHYRQCADPDAARAAVTRAAEALDGVRLIGGKQVVNLVPAEAPGKGGALLAACERLGCPRAIFVGDDDTDEDVFALGRSEMLLTIRVGCDLESAAEWCLEDQAAMDRLLESLIAGCRPADSQARQPPDRYAR